MTTVVMTTVRKKRIHRHGENEVVRADQLSSRSWPLDPRARELEMKAKSVTVGSERILVLDQGKEAFGAITDFANKVQVSGAAATVAFAHAGLAARSYKPLSTSNAKSLA
ncbi:hypothetical protein QA635_07920 [Bradyrhizobium brasilense]|uniref:hypothetical protein n=1 Tax=Bradyrhizobium brasilense TaxID=1419277 RepID=UPI0024B191D4|nr:hypothetical protein [Bradyrhizobium australafricanum]WFU34344.1 hypothetical protein QA635_07920 [Bradyrhizobium australafricanum]